ncbi:hypothetical protein Tco_0601630 [Tanacetum coccineum]
MKNQEHYTDITSSKPIKPQSEWINLMHGEQSPKTLKSQQQRKQSEPCKAYKQSYNVRPKSVLENPLKITIGLTKENMSDKTKKPQESSLNWKPLHNDWATTTSKPKEVQAYNLKDNKCRYNRKGFLEDDDSSDDLIFIVDPGWDDYCLHELKLNRPVLDYVPYRLREIHCLLLLTTTVSPDTFLSPFLRRDPERLAEEESCKEDPAGLSLLDRGDEDDDARRST